MKVNLDCVFDDEYFFEFYYFLKENGEEKIERFCILVLWVGYLWIYLWILNRNIIK